MSDNNLRTLHGGHIIDQQTLTHHFFEPTVVFLNFFFESLSQHYFLRSENSCEQVDRGGNGLLYT